MRTIPAGITWTRTGRTRLVCTIRHEPEVIYEPRDYVNWNTFGQKLGWFDGLFGIEIIGL